MDTCAQLTNKVVQILEQKNQNNNMTETNESEIISILGDILKELKTISWDQMCLIGTVRDVEKNILAKMGDCNKPITESQCESDTIEQTPTINKNQPVTSRRRKTKNDPSAKYLNSVQLCDKYNENELAMKLFGKKSITTKEINDLVVKAKFASTFEKGNGLKAIPLGIGSGVVANVDSHLVYVNSEHTDNMLAMLYEKFAGMENK